MNKDPDITFKEGDEVRIDLIVPIQFTVKSKTPLELSVLTRAAVADMNVGRRQVSGTLYKFKQTPCRAADPPEVSLLELKELWATAGHREVAAQLSQQHPCVLAQFILLGATERWLDVVGLTILTNLTVDVLTDANKERFQLKE